MSKGTWALTGRYWDKVYGKKTMDDTDQIDYKTRYERLVALCRALIKANKDDAPVIEGRILQALRTWDEMK